jgi:hypothetical protein
MFIGRKRYKPLSLENVNITRETGSITGPKGISSEINRDCDIIQFNHLIVINPSNDFYMKSINIINGGATFIKIPAIHMGVKHTTYKGKPAIIYKLPKIVREYKSILCASIWHIIRVDLITHGDFEKYKIFLDKQYINEDNVRHRISYGNFSINIPQYVTYSFLHFKGRQTLNITNFSGNSRGFFFQCNPNKLTYFRLSFDNKVYIELSESQVYEYVKCVNENMLYIPFDMTIDLSQISNIEFTFDCNDIFHGCLSSVIMDEVAYLGNMSALRKNYKLKCADFIQPLFESMKKKQPIPENINIPTNVDRNKMNKLLNYTRREALLLKRYELRNRLGLRGK